MFLFFTPSVLFVAIEYRLLKACEGALVHMENSLHVFHKVFSREILSANLKLLMLASQGFSQIDGIIKMKKIVTRRDIRN